MHGLEIRGGEGPWACFDRCPKMPSAKSISAFTSGLNACTYGHRSHSYLVEKLGLGEAVVPALSDNYEKEQAQAPKSIRPNFAF